jgi:hypothetical protein
MRDATFETIDRLSHQSHQSHQSRLSRQLHPGALDAIAPALARSGFRAAIIPVLARGGESFGRARIAVSPARGFARCPREA